MRLPPIALERHQSVGAADPHLRWSVVALELAECPHRRGFESSRSREGSPPAKSVACEPAAVRAYPHQTVIARRCVGKHGDYRPRRQAERPAARDDGPPGDLCKAARSRDPRAHSVGRSANRGEGIDSSGRQSVVGREYIPRPVSQSREPRRPRADPQHSRAIFGLKAHQGKDTVPGKAVSLVEYGQPVLTESCESALCRYPELVLAVVTKTREEVNDDVVWKSVGRRERGQSSVGPANQPFPRSNPQLSAAASRRPLENGQCIAVRQVCGQRRVDKPVLLEPVQPTAEGSKVDASIRGCTHCAHVVRGEVIGHRDVGPPEPIVTGGAILCANPEEPRRIETHLIYRILRQSIAICVNPDSWSSKWHRIDSRGNVRNYRKHVSAGCPMVLPTGLVRWTLFGWTSSGTNESRESVEHFAISYHSRLARATKSHDRLQVFDSLPIYALGAVLARINPKTHLEAPANGNQQLERKL